MEQDSPTRHEYYEGEIYAMAGGTPDHAALAATFLRLLGNEKLEHYRAIATLREVLIIAHDRPHVTNWVRSESGGWVAHEYSRGESVALRCAHSQLAIDDLYRRSLEDG